MSFKREFDSQSATDEEAAAKPPKKQRMHDGASNGKGKHHSSAPTTDLTYGQRYVFSSLDEPTVPYDEDLEFEDEQDALAYLKAVRQEAGGIPHLLVAAKAGPQLPPRPGPDELCYDEEDVDRALYDTGLGDTRGYYFDGTYTAAPGPESEDELSSEGDAGDEKRIYEAYYSSIIHRFNQLRDLLHQDPPASALSALSSEHATNVGPSAPRSQSFLVWRGRLLRTDPLPAQVAAMDKESVLWLLRVILNGKLMQHGSHLRERTSRWLWALLARLPDRGELDHTDVGWVRELGKRAVLMMTSIAQMAALREQVELDEGGRDDDEDGLDDDPVKQERDEDGHEIKVEVDGDAEEIETCSAGSAPMEDSASEGGEVLVGPAPVTQDAEADIEAAKARLLARLDAVEDTPPEPGFVPVAEPEIPTPAPPSQPSAHEVGGGGDDVPFDAARARINMRATLNMILTVAGEFYGQRDLLEFRDPFPGL